MKEKDHAINKVIINFSETNKKRFNQMYKNSVIIKIAELVLLWTNFPLPLVLEGINKWNLKKNNI